MKKLIVSLLGVLLLAASIVKGQAEFPLLQAQYEENKAIVEALVLYPEDIRSAIFEVSTHPELIIKVDRASKASSQKFASIINKYNQNVQEQFYDLSRYPGLIKILCIKDNATEKQIEAVLKEYPDEIHATAKQFSRHELVTLKQIDLLNEETQAAFNKLVNTYTESTATAIRKLTQEPEVMSMLAENIDLVILAGDAYKQNPKWITHKADSMNLAVAAQNANEMNAWAEELESDPEAMKELEEAAKDYAKENNYEEEEYNSSKNETTVNVIYTYRPYYYWYGYPYWYSYSWWYPYPYWYHWGFYYSYPGTVIVIGLPSYHFSWWFLYHHHHWNHYPHLMHHVFTHHYNHRTNTGLHVAVQSWERDNENIVGKDWLRDKTTRMDRINEYATFTKNYDTYNAERPGQKVTKEEYLTTHKKDYPSFAPPKTKPVQEVKSYDGKANYPKTKEVVKPKTGDVKTPPIKKAEPKYYPEKKHPDVPKTQPKKTYYPKKEIKVQTPVVKPKVQPKVQPKIQPKSKNKPIDKNRSRP